jgi:hypothetical protein
MVLVANLPGLVVVLASGRPATAPAATGGRVRA